MMGVEQLPWNLMRTAMNGYAFFMQCFACGHTNVGHQMVNPVMHAMVSANGRGPKIARCAVCTERMPHLEDRVYASTRRDTYYWWGSKKPDNVQAISRSHLPLWALPKYNWTP